MESSKAFVEYLYQIEEFLREPKTQEALMDCKKITIQRDSLSFVFKLVIEE